MRNESGLREIGGEPQKLTERRFSLFVAVTTATTLMRSLAATRAMRRPASLTLMIAMMMILCGIAIQARADSDALTATQRTEDAPLTSLLQLDSSAQARVGASSKLRSLAQYSRLSRFEREQRARNRRAIKLAQKRAASAFRKDPAHLPRTVRGGRTNFGCGAHRCKCPLPLGAGFGELRVKGYELLSHQRLLESAACFKDALNLYLDRVGRYVVAKGDGSVGTTELSSKPAAQAAKGPIALPTDESLTSAHDAAQSILDRLNHGPQDGWSSGLSTAAPSLERVQHLGDAADRAAEAVKRFEGHAQGDPDGFWHQEAHGPDASLASRAASHPPWTPSTSRAHLQSVAKVYEQQLRQQWQSWSKENAEAAAAKAKAAKKK